MFCHNSTVTKQVTARESPRVRLDSPLHSMNKHCGKSTLLRTAINFNCSETMKLCTFGGRQFDCCKYIEPKITNLGKCHSLDMRGAREWMQKQTVAGVNSGTCYFRPKTGETVVKSGQQPTPPNFLIHR
ncbi:hypothetical protein NECAME_11711 [Necator americanus]|uniref:Uncharacterized protein n=1 Tax=Necator americanus TaxID=51031 RepID=W2T321_NECAM|nr:hypothetical protein NECAME_11711 [Necator americanus]ETN76405.1 hypothetical protein NECAME_11711 [Necator americanus]